MTATKTKPENKKSCYPDVNPNPDFAAIEGDVLTHWGKEGLFKRSVEARDADNEFVFYDGPPFANGLPHYGHLLTGFVKDAIARYQTMNGKRVERRFGWDCHGLPAEMGSEKELGISGRLAIQKFGIDKFNEHCRTSVMKYTQDWEYYVTRQARWVDFKNDYKTMDPNFMESVLWAFKQLYEKGLVYESFRVSPYSWAAESTVSNFETKMDNSYREREDKAITVAFELEEKPKGAPDADKYYVLAWTTTPWTLPSNLALAVNVEMEYSQLVRDRKTVHPNLVNLFKNEQEKICFIISSNRRGSYSSELNTMHHDIETNKPYLPDSENNISGSNLVGLSYTPLFPYFKDHQPGTAFKILDGSSFVTDGDGTGIVHIAPGFGEDDQRVAEANGIKLVVPVDGQGKFIGKAFGGFQGNAFQSNAFQSTNPNAIYDLQNLKLVGLNVIAQTEGKTDDEPYKAEQLQKFGLANMRIVTYLKNHYPDGNNRVIKEEQIKHNYPHCWRTDQPLIYRAMPSWYVEVTKFRDRAVELNKQINWIPAHVRDGQMGHMLATAPDWSISRNRFWGTPIPVWRAKSGKIIVIGSIAELEQLSGQKVKDLHRPYIDTIKITKDGEEYTRVEDVFDCWFESGSMPFAQVHYPFENKDWFDNHFPADFITEYVGQTRGWFNTLIMLSTALFDKPPFLNCICHGVVLDSETGLKYSKRLKNYRDPKEVMDKFGADALRWMMLASPVMRGADIMVDPDGKFIRDVVRLAIKPIWNAYNFFCLYANADGIQAKLIHESSDVMDSYILAKCKQAVEAIKAAFDAYDTPSACDAIMQFFEALNNWYIRRNKERFWASEHSADKQAAYDTLYTVITALCRAAAPLLPLTTEEIYRGLTGEPSVHLAEFPDVSNIVASRDLANHMDFARDVCNAALAVRAKLNLRVRQPLNLLQLTNNPILLDYVKGGEDSVVTHWNYLVGVIKDEVNVKELKSGSEKESITDYATLKLAINSSVVGKRLPEKMKQILPASKKGEWEYAESTVRVAGEILKLGEYTIHLEPKPEFKDRAQALSTNDALVILDTTITPELEAEGIARDVVRMIQQARKDGNFNVSDRIKLFISAQPNIMSAIATHKAYIMEQTLTAELLSASPANAKFTAEVELDEHKVSLALSLD